jgi:hypothetical protein
MMRCAINHGAIDFRPSSLTDRGAHLRSKYYVFLYKTKGLYLLNSPGTSTGMSIELPFIEGQIDAFTNTMWWSLDHKFGRLIRPPARKNPNILTTTIDHLQGIWDSVVTRLSLAFIIPHVLRVFITVENPFRVGWYLVCFCIAWPWIYEIFIYTWFLDPLRKLPAPKASHVCASFDV